jgi:hypothetical protein
VDAGGDETGASLAVAGADEFSAAGEVDRIRFSSFLSMGRCSSKELSLSFRRAIEPDLRVCGDRPPIIAPHHEPSPN